MIRLERHRCAEPPLDVTIIEDTQDFAALEGEWEELYRSSPAATPFQTWAWLYSWWEFYGEDYELRLVAVRYADLLVGLIPLMLERRRGFRRLLFIGTGITDHLDMLVREGWEDGAAKAGTRALRQMGSWWVADLQELRPKAAAWSIFWQWDGFRAHTWQSNSLIIDAEPWDELIMSLTRNRREKARKTIRRAKEDGVRCHLADPDRVEQGAHRWLTLHQEYWKGREISPEHLSQRFQSHIVAAAKRMTSSGLGGIYEFWRDGEVVASDFVVVGHDFVAQYLGGANDYALRRFQVSSLFMWNYINVALSHGITLVSMLRGEEPYKLRWNPKIIPNYRLILGQELIPFAPYAACHLLRSRIAEYAKPEHTPAWIKPAADRLKRFLPK